VLNIEGGKEAGTAWLWLSHYGFRSEMPVAYGAKMNDRILMTKEVKRHQVLTVDALLSGRGEAWTTDWLERTLLPRTVYHEECALRPGQNQLHLINCQVAALVVTNRRGRPAAQAYLSQLDKDLKRYRRQFVLAAQHDPDCPVRPTEEEAKQGMMVFSPPADQWFDRTYVPDAGHRAKAVRLTAATGSSAMTALAVVSASGGDLRPVVGDLRSGKGGRLPGRSCQVHAMERVPVVRDGCAYYQAFAVGSQLRSVRPRKVSWLVLQVRVPDRMTAGTYEGQMRIPSGRGTGTVPVKVEVVALPREKTDKPTVFGVSGWASAFEAYRSYSTLLPKPEQKRVGKAVLDALAAHGLNSVRLHGPGLSRGRRSAPQRFEEALKDRLYLTGSGKHLVDVEQSLKTIEALQPGTDRYRKVAGVIVSAGDAAAGKHSFTGYALLCGYMDDRNRDEMAKVVRAIRRSGGRPAVLARLSALSGLGRSARRQLLADLDTLVVGGGAGLRSLAAEFKAPASDKTLAVGAVYADEYTCGFYSWGVGADGALVEQAFSFVPFFNGFWFDGRGLLLPDRAIGTFRATLGMLMFQQGMEDYLLARRCQELAESARKRGVDAGGLEKVLGEIRGTADKAQPGFDLERFQPRGVSRQVLLQWRQSLLAQAQKVHEGMTGSPPAKRIAPPAP
jgi:hypothetical protein